MLWRGSASKEIRKLMERVSKTFGSPENVAPGLLLLRTRLKVEVEDEVGLRLRLRLKLRG